MLTRLNKLLFAVVLLYSQLGYSELSRPVVVGYTSATSFPYIMKPGSEFTDMPGISIDILRQAADNLNIHLAYKRMPGQRVLRSLQRGAIDVALIFSYKPSRTIYGQYPLVEGEINGDYRMSSLDYKLYKRSGSSLSWDGKRFQHLHTELAAVLNYSIVSDLRGMNVRVLEAENTKSVFMLLNKKRVDGAVVQESVADSVIVKEGFSQLEKSNIPVKSKYYYLIFSHQFYANNKVLAQKIWEFIKNNRDEISQNRLSIYLKSLMQDK